MEQHKKDPEMVLREEQLSFVSLRFKESHVCHLFPLRFFYRTVLNNT